MTDPTVTQADREAAADCVKKGVSQPLPADILNGNYDQWFFVQAFARHRLAGIAQGAAEAEARVAALEEALQASLEFLDGFGDVYGRAASRRRLRLVREIHALTERKETDNG